MKTTTLTFTAVVTLTALLGLQSTYASCESDCLGANSACQWKVLADRTGQTGIAACNSIYDNCVGGCRSNVGGGSTLRRE